MRILISTFILGVLCTTPKSILAGNRNSRIHLSYVEESIPEAGTIRKTKVAFDSLSFVCQPPNAWTQEVDEENSRVQFRSFQLGAGISITTFPKNPVIPSSKGLRARLAQEFSDLEILEEYKAYTGGPEGTAFEIRQIVSGKFRVHMIVLYLPTEQGMIELKLAAPEENFEKCRSCWVPFLNSFATHRSEG